MNKVNLLPEEIKDELAQSKKNRELRKLFAKLLLIFIATFIIWGGAYYYTGLKIAESTATLKGKEAIIEKYGKLEDDAKNTAEKLSNIKQIEGNTNKWSGVIAEINKVVPSGVYLTGVKLDSNTKVRTQITGYAQTKSNVASFQEALEKSDKFEFVDIESSQTQADITTGAGKENFTLSMSLSKEALK